MTKRNDTFRGAQTYSPGPNEEALAASAHERGEHHDKRVPCPRCFAEADREVFASIPRHVQLMLVDLVRAHAARQHPGLDVPRCVSCIVDRRYAGPRNEHLESTSADDH